MDLLSLVLDVPPRPPPATAETAGGGTPTADLPGAVGAGPALSFAAGMLLLQPGYHRHCCAWMRDAARGVHHAHLLGVIHRDLKPGNLMLGRDGRVRVIDFGLARCFDDATLTATGQLLGSPLYMSPEQVTGRIQLTAQTDVYSLALVLYELLTLGPPIPAGNREELFQRIIARPLEPLTRVNPAVAAPLAAVVHKASAKDPADRYESAGSFADDLDRWLAGQPVTAGAYRPQDEEDTVLLNTRPLVIAGLTIQLLVGTAGWFGYGSFLSAMSLSTRAELVRRGFFGPFLSWGEAGEVLAFVIGGLLAAAGGWVAKGYRGAYWVGWAGVLVLAASALALVGFARSFAVVTDKSVWLRTVLGVVVLAQVIWTGAQYGRRRVRVWFEAARQARRRAASDALFRGRPWHFNPPQGGENDPAPPKPN